ncbi:MAG TPA: LysM peptidoglycan-binding domain-containing protein [Afifellaceae bacterium]|nr:LysM peptidoglycan-binding domain-containing protein [Afifellaceae bacterium]
MTSRQIQILVGLLIVLFIGIGLVFLADSNRRKLAEQMAEEKVAETRPAEPAVSAEAKSDKEQQQAAAEDAAAGEASGKPSFDVARFEPSGDGVVAGLAKPGALAELLANGEPISSTTANEVGEWVIVLEKPLGAGSHDLSVRSAVADGEKILSDEFIAVVVPETPDGEVLVVASEPGKASEILARPSATAPAGEAKPTEMASAESAASPSGGAEVGEQASAAGPGAGQPATAAEESSGGSSGETEVAAVSEPQPNEDMQAATPAQESASAEQAEAPAEQAEAPAAQADAEVAPAATPETGTESSEMAAQTPASGEQPATATTDVAGADASGADGASDAAQPMDMASASTSTDEPGPEAMNEAGQAAVAPAGTAKPDSTETAAAAPGEAATQSTESTAEQTMAMAPAADAAAAQSAADKPAAEQSAAAPAADAGTAAAGAMASDQSEQAAEPEAQVAATEPDESGSGQQGTDAGQVASVESNAAAMPESQADAAAPALEMAAKSEPEPVVEEPKREYSLALEAVETEDRMVYAAGTGNPGTVVRIYADDTYVGETSTNDDGRWLLETEAEIAAGNVVVRADELQEGSADVVRRAEVPFFKQADAIALLPTTAKAGAGAGENAAGGELLAPRSVIIRSGDNLWTISRRTYGRGIRYTTVYQANNDQIRNPHLIYPGQVFVLPEGDTAWTQ